MAQTETEGQEENFHELNTILCLSGTQALP